MIRTSLDGMLSTNGDDLVLSFTATELRIVVRGGAGTEQVFGVDLGKLDREDTDALKAFLSQLLASLGTKAAPPAWSPHRIGEGQPRSGTVITGDPK
jgi:hypothetical protein